MDRRPSFVLKNERNEPTLQKRNKTTEKQMYAEI